MSEKRGAEAATAARAPATARDELILPGFVVGAVDETEDSISFDDRVADVGLLDLQVAYEAGRRATDDALAARVAKLEEALGSDDAGLDDERRARVIAYLDREYGDDARPDAEELQRIKREWMRTRSP